MFLTVHCDACRTTGGLYRKADFSKQSSPTSEHPLPSRKSWATSHAFCFVKVCGGLSEQALYNVCRLMPTGLDVMSVLGSTRAKEIMAKAKITNFCRYEKMHSQLQKTISGYDTSKWTKNLYNAWLWLLQPLLVDKPKGYPNWMRSFMWRQKDLVTSLSSWAQLRHDTILYVKQSYTRAAKGDTAMAREKMP